MFFCLVQCCPQGAEASAERGKAPRDAVGSTAPGKAQTSPRKLHPFPMRPRGPDLSHDCGQESSRRAYKVWAPYSLLLSSDGTHLPPPQYGSRSTEALSTHEKAKEHGCE